MTDNGIILEPEVSLVGKPVLDIDGLNKFLESKGKEWPELAAKLESMSDLGDHDAEWIVEGAGRNCYMSWPDIGGEAKGRSHEDHIHHIIEVGHGSCIEHANYNFVIWNVSRSLTHELVRHRLASYSQLSQRYVESKNVSFIMPPAIQAMRTTNPELVQEWINHCLSCRAMYEKLTSGLAELYSDVQDKTERRKKAREAARSVLPNATETNLFVTMNARAIRHLLEMRGSKFADMEIRALAIKMFKIFEREAPLLSFGLKLVKSEDGTETIESDYRRV